MISKQEVKNIANLSRLKLTEREEAKMQNDLGGILDYINLLKEVKIKKEKVWQKRKVAGVAFEDLSRQDLSRKQSFEIINKLINLSSEKEKGCIRTKAVF